MLPLENVSTSCPAGIVNVCDDGDLLTEEKIHAFQKDRMKKDNHNRSKIAIILSEILLWSLLPLIFFLYSFSLFETVIYIICLIVYTTCLINFL